MILAKAPLFVPADNDRLLSSAVTKDFRATVLDLEDGCAPGNLAAAIRELPANIDRLAKSAKAVWLRLPGPDEGAALLREMNASLLQIIVIPKVTSVADITCVDEALSATGNTHTRLCLLIEAPDALGRVAQLLTVSGRTVAAAIGAEDFCRELKLDAADPTTDIAWAHNHLLLQTHASGRLPYGVVSQFREYQDMAGYGAAARRSYGLGYQGTFCIHPDQVPIAESAFRPTTDSLKRAHRIVEKFEAGGGATVGVDGSMVDRPVYEAAMRLIDDSGF